MSQRAAKAPTPAEEVVAGVHATPEDALVRLHVRRVLDRLSEDERRLLTLRYVDDLTQDDVAAALGIPSGTAKVPAPPAADATPGDAGRLMASSKHHPEQQVAKALSHPLRVRLLTILNESTSSPRELAARVGAPLENVAYHVRRLAELGCIELVETRASGNAVEHLYRAQVRPFLVDEHWTDLPAPLRRSISGQILEQIFDDVRRSVVAEAFDAKEDRFLLRMPLVVDERGWADLKEALVDAMDRAFEIQAESAERLVESGAEGMATKLVIMHFLGAESLLDPPLDGDGSAPT